MIYFLMDPMEHICNSLWQINSLIKKNYILLKIWVFFILNVYCYIFPQVTIFYPHVIYLHDENLFILCFLEGTTDNLNLSFKKFFCGPFLFSWGFFFFFVFFFFPCIEIAWKVLGEHISQFIGNLFLYTINEVSISKFFRNS